MFFTKSAAVKIFLVCCLVAAVRAESDSSEESLEDGEMRIVNGVIITIDKAPYTVQLRNPVQGAYCGGTLVTSQHVVTAAHCFDSWQKEDIVVVAGVSTRSEVGETRLIAKLTIHPAYKAFTINGENTDVAVIKLDKPLVPNRNIAIMTDLCSKQLVESDIMQISGWGAIDARRTIAEELRTIFRPVTKCSYVQSTWICTPPGNGGVCVGDSGGPGIFNDELCAVVSHGGVCGASMSYFVNVYAVRDFINECIKN